MNIDISSEVEVLESTPIEEVEIELLEMLVNETNVSRGIIK
jgi:hypothetical protein